MLTRLVRQQLAALNQQLSALDFPYSDPSPNFDRSKVKGLVISLLTLAEAHNAKSTALEIAGGGKLYNVVVQDEKVASQLLNNGKLKKRVTIIPLNKIIGSGPPAAVRPRVVASIAPFAHSHTNPETGKGSEDCPRQSRLCHLACRISRGGLCGDGVRIRTDPHLRR